MILFFKSKCNINCLNVKSECMTFNLALYVFLFEWCISIKLFDQRFTNSEEFSKKFIPTSSFKTPKHEGILKISKMHLSLLNDWSCFELKGISFKMLRGAKQTVIIAFSLITTLSNSFSWSHLQNIAVKTTKTEHNERQQTWLDTS